MSCSTTTTTTCYPCSQSTASCECPHGVIDTACVQYTGEDLDNINVQTGDYLDEILEELNNFTFSETNFIVNETDSIYAIENGINGHSPYYYLRIDPDEDNAITVSPLGVMVDSTLIGDGKVKVDSSDPKAYLEDQVMAGTDANSIITVTPTNIGGVIYLVPSINIINLINYIATYNLDLLCSIVQQCVPEESTTTTTSTTTTSTTTTSTSTTTTTTVAPNDFVLNNTSGIAVPFTVFLTDSVTFIDYIMDNTTGDNQSASYSYSGTINTSDVVLQHAGTEDVNIQVKVNTVEIYNSLDSVGSTTVNVDPQSDIEVNLTAAPTTTTTTTTAAPCHSYTIENNQVSSQRVTYVDCDTFNTPDFFLAPTASLTVCAVQGTVDAADCDVTDNGTC